MSTEPPNNNEVVHRGLQYCLRKMRVRKSVPKIGSDLKLHNFYRNGDKPVELHFYLKYVKSVRFHRIVRNTGGTVKIRP